MVFADTSGLMALFNKKDEKHLHAKAWYTEINPKLFITDYIVDELLTLALTRVGKTFALGISDFIKKTDYVKIVKVSEKDFYNAWEIFEKYADKNWSLTDCTSYVIIKQQKFEKAFSFDAHFDQFETITREPVQSG